MLFLIYLQKKQYMTQQIKEEIQQPAILNKAVHHFESVLSKRIFYAVESQIKKGFGLQIDFNQALWMDVPTKILSNQHYDDLKKASRELQKARFEFNDDANQSFNHIQPFPVVQYQRRWGVVKVKVESEALHILAELTKGYFWYKLKAALSLSSKYAQRWYELFSEKKDLYKWEGVEIEYIRKIMGIEEFEYKSNGMFLKRVVYESIKEINEKTDLYITYRPMMGLKRPIIGFDFSIGGQKAKGEAEIYANIEKYYEELKQLSPADMSRKLVEIQKEYSLNEKIFNQVMQNPRLIDAVLEADAKIKAGKATVQTTKARYMGGVIKKAKSDKYL